MQTTHHRVEVFKPRRHPGKPTVALDGGVGDFDGFGDGGSKGFKPAAIFAGLCKSVERLFGFFQLPCRVVVER